jgi:hypothetical protein
MLCTVTRINNKIVLGHVNWKRTDDEEYKKREIDTRALVISNVFVVY